MASISLQPSDVAIDDSKILECSISANLEPAQSENDQYDLQVSVSSNILHVDDDEAFLDMAIAVERGDAPTYDIELVTRTRFFFRRETSEDEKNDYLRAEGATRAYDFAKIYIKTLTSFGIWDAFVLPDLPAE